LPVYASSQAALSTGALVTFVAGALAGAIDEPTAHELHNLILVALLVGGHPHCGEVTNLLKHRVNILHRLLPAGGEAT
jgi:hypothetical protein